MKRLLTKLLGDAGEHYVAFELARRGVSPAMLSTNTKGAVILATISGKNVVSIQVKASSAKNDPRTWAVGKKAPLVSENFIYVFLNIGSDLSKPIECFVVPSEVVCSSVNWEASMPQFRIKASMEKKYHNDWQLILEQLSETRANKSLQPTPLRGAAEFGRSRAWPAPAVNAVFNANWNNSL